MPRESSIPDPKLVGRTLKIQDPSTENGLSTCTVGYAVDAQLRACSLNEICARVDLGSYYPCLVFTDVGGQPNARPL